MGVNWQNSVSSCSNGLWTGSSFPLAVCLFVCLSKNTDLCDVLFQHFPEPVYNRYYNSNGEIVESEGMDGH